MLTDLDMPYMETLIKSKAQPSPFDDSEGQRNQVSYMIGFNCTERKVIRRNTHLCQGIEQRALANIRKAHDADLLPKICKTALDNSKQHASSQHLHIT